MADARCAWCGAVLSPPDEPPPAAAAKVAGRATVALMTTPGYWWCPTPSCSIITTRVETIGEAIERGIATGDDALVDDALRQTDTDE